MIAELLALLVEEPLELPLQWNLLVQLHIRKFHRGLESLFFACRDYQATCPQGRIFKRGLGGCCLISEGLQHAPFRESSIDSSIGVVNGMSLHARLLFRR